MTDVPNEPVPGSTPEPPAALPPAPATPPPATPPPATPLSPGPGAARPPTFEERMERFGREANDAGERLGRRAEEAANRWSKDPGVVRVTDTAGRIWGLLVLLVGLWFFADVTLGYDMPSISWRDLWPIVLIGIGLLIVGRGMTRRRM